MFNAIEHLGTFWTMQKVCFMEVEKKLPWMTRALLPAATGSFQRLIPT